VVGERLPDPSKAAADFTKEGSGHAPGHRATEGSDHAPTTSGQGGVCPSKVSGMPIINNDRNDMVEG